MMLIVPSVALVRAVTKTFKHSHITPSFKSLHLLKIKQRIHYKMISITNNLLHSSDPQYLHKLINVTPSGKTRSSEYLCVLLPPLTSKLKFSNCSFRISATHLWNSLPPNLRTYAPVSDETIINITSINCLSVSATFKSLSLSRNRFISHLKTYLFSLSFPYNLLICHVSFPNSTGTFFVCLRLRF